MSTVKHLVLALLGFALPMVRAMGGCLSILRDPDGDPTSPDTGKVPGRPCRNDPIPPNAWQCLPLPFPTVECIVEDLKICGNIGPGLSVFYSMGASTVQTRTGFADVQNPPGVMFNDALGDSWWDPVIFARSVELGLDGSHKDRTEYFRNIFAIAMAQASAGEVFFVTKSRTGDAIPPGDPGIFQNPFTLPNIWRQMELPNLQRNRAITAITNVVVEENFRRYTDWRQGDGNLFQLPSLDPSNPPPMNPVKKRDVSGAACSVQASTITKAPSTSTTAADAIRPGPTLSCLLHNQDPDQGILQAYCLCNGSITLAPLPATSAQSESCAYSTMPGTSASEAVTTQTQVWTTNCQACTIVGGVADQETCTPVSGCKPTSAPVPTIAAWIGNLSTIDIGNAEDGNGGKDLAQEMFTKLKGSCDASNRTCKSTPAVMDNVEAVLLDGEEPLKPAMYFQDAVLYV